MWTTRRLVLLALALGTTTARARHTSTHTTAFIATDVVDQTRTQAEQLCTAAGCSGLATTAEIEATSWQPGSWWAWGWSESMLTMRVRYYGGTCFECVNSTSIECGTSPYTNTQLSWSLSDGYCDDGGPSADFSIFPLGYDCTDCGVRGTRSIESSSSAPSAGAYCTGCPRVLLLPPSAPPSTASPPPPSPSTPPPSISSPPTLAPPTSNNPPASPSIPPPSAFRVARQLRQAALHHRRLRVARRLRQAALHHRMPRRRLQASHQRRQLLHPCPRCQLRPHRLQRRPLSALAVSF